MKITKREMIIEIKKAIIKAGKVNPGIQYNDKYDIEFGDYSIMYYKLSGILEVFKNDNGIKWRNIFTVSKPLVEFIYDQIKEKGVK